MRVWVDADACPVKQEIYRVAARLKVPVTLVAARWMRTPEGELFRLEVVGDGFDRADDHIVEGVGPRDLVVTDDVPLASRCVERGAWVITSRGKRLDEDNVGDALAVRDLAAELRSAGERIGGPAPFRPQDRSKFLHGFDQLLLQRQRQLGDS